MVKNLLVYKNIKFGLNNLSQAMVNSVGGNRGDNPRPRFKNGEKVFLLFQGTPVTVDSEASDTSGWKSYNVKFEDGHCFTCGADDIAYGDDPLFLMVQECKMIMRDNGYNSLAMGLDKDGSWRSFYFASMEDYQRIHQENREIKFKYYWSLNLQNEKSNSDTEQVGESPS